MKRKTQGFTLIELMIVLAIIGILATIAIPMYKDYSIRTQVAEGINLTGSAKTSVGEYYNDYGDWPADNDAAGLAAANTISGKYVASVEVDGAVIRVTFGNSAHAEINGQEMTLTVANNDGSYVWTCAGVGIATKHLPVACR